MKTTVAVLALGLLAGCAGQHEIHHSNHFSKNGYVKGEKFAGVYKEQTLTINPELITPELLQSFLHQLSYLKKPSVVSEHALPELRVTKAQLQTTLEALQHAAASKTKLSFTAWQLAGEDGRGNVQFTGYYVPILPVRKSATAEFRFPLYKKPVNPNPLPTREQIDFEAALANQGLELFYSKSLIDNFFMQVQGSGVVEDETGQQHLLSYGGGNGYPYRSLGKVLIEQGHYTPEQMSAQAITEWLKKNPERQRELMRHNQSYTFFQIGPKQPVGAANVPLTPLHSIAVDPAYIPLGSVLLAQVPVLDNEGQFLRHKLQLVVAQDKGAAIKSPGRIDLYQGIGEEAQARASALRHYGKIWLLLAP